MIAAGERRDGLANFQYGLAAGQLRSLFESLHVFGEEAARAWCILRDPRRADDPAVCQAGPRA